MKKKHIPQKMIDDARKLYVKYGGRCITQIEAEMRALGWPFRRQVLYTTRHTTGVTLGWPERYGWRRLLSPEQQRQLGRRHIGRNRFEQWLGRTFPGWQWRWRYQRYLYQKLADVTNGRTRRLMIFLPPRHGKSELVTVRYTAWRMLQQPDLNVIVGSYNQRLADRFSRKIRRIVTEAGSSGTPTCIPASPRPSFPASSAPAPRPISTASEWEMPGGGVLRSAGVGAGIAGFGAGLIIIDDPVKNRAEAESETYRTRVDEWFRDDIYTRLEPDAAIILIQTRWHEDDLAGRLLREQSEGGDQWEVVNLPALAEAENDAATRGHGDAATVAGNAGALACIPASQKNLPASQKHTDPIGRRPGEALCPERFDEAALAKIRRKLGSYSFASLYQQRPAPADGGRFKRSWFKNIVERAPDGLRWKRGWDLAVSVKTSADYTASFRCARDAAGNLYIADGIRGRLEYPDQRRLIIERMRAEPDTEHGIEAAIHGRAVVQDIRRDWRMGRFAFRNITVRGDKLTRALAWLNLAEEGKVILVRGPWIDDFLDEITRFPTGRHDDQLDAVSLAVNMITNAPSKLYFF